MRDLPYRERLLPGHGLGTPSPVMPSDIEHIIRELQFLRSELLKIKKALAEHGIRVD